MTKLYTWSSKWNYVTYAKGSSSTDWLITEWRVYAFACAAARSVASSPDPRLWDKATTWSARLPLIVTPQGRRGFRSSTGWQYLTPKARRQMNSCINTHMLHVWNISIHIWNHIYLGHFGGKCWWVFQTWSIGDRYMGQNSVPKKTFKTNILNFWSWVLNFDQSQNGFCEKKQAFSAWRAVTGTASGLNIHVYQTSCEVTHWIGMKNVSGILVACTDAVNLYKLDTLAVTPLHLARRSMAWSCPCPNQRTLSYLILGCHIFTTSSPNLPPAFSIITSTFDFHVIRFVGYISTWSWVFLAPQDYPLI